MRGSGGDPSVGFDQVAQASEATTRLPGADMTMTMTMDADALPHPVTMSGSGFQNLRTRSGRFKMDMSALSDVNPNIPANAEMEEIFAYPDVYFRSPIFASKVAPGKWVKLDLRAAGRQIGVNFDTFMQNDPTQSLRYLRVTAADVKRVGPERVRGVATSHYTGTIDYRKIPDFFPAGAKRDEARKSVDRLIELGGPTKAPMAIWIDKRNLVRRMSFTMDMKMQGQHLKMDMTMELFNFGPKPKVKPPAASDVVQAPTSGAQAGP